MDEVQSLLEYLRNDGMEKLIKSGWVDKQPIDHRTFNKRWRPKWLELHPHAVVWFNEPNSIPRGYVLLAPTATVHEQPGRGGGAIEVTSASGRKLRIRVGNPQLEPLARSHEQHEWFEAISGALRAQCEALAREANRRRSCTGPQAKKALTVASGKAAVELRFHYQSSARSSKGKGSSRSLDGFAGSGGCGDTDGEDIADCLPSAGSAAGTTAAQGAGCRWGGGGHGDGNHQPQAQAQLMAASAAADHSPAVGGEHWKGWDTVHAGERLTLATT